MILLQTPVDCGPALQTRDAFFHYLPLDEGGATGDLSVTGAGRMVIGPGEKYLPTGHPTLYQFDWHCGRTLPEYQLILVTDGAGEFDSQATGLVRFEGPALIFVFPGVWHRYRPVPDVGWTERWFSFHGDSFSRLFAMGSFGPRHSVATPHDSQRLAADFDDALDMIHSRSLRDSAVLTFHLLRIVASAVAERLQDEGEFGMVPSGKSARTVDDPIVSKALEIIWSHGQYPMSVSDIARQLPVTRRTLDRRFVEATGHTVLEEINCCRLSRAKRLLANTDQPIKTVAHLAGFSSTERMRVLFVEREGKSPSEYRKCASQTGQVQNAASQD